MPNVASIIEEQSLLLKDEAAIIDATSQSQVSYGQLEDRVASMSFQLRKELNGLQDQKVAILLPNSIDWITAYYSILATGNVVVSLNQNWPGEIIKTILDKIDVCSVVTNTDYSKKISRKNEIINIDERDPLTTKQGLKIEEKQFSDIATIQFTSGTTNLPKAVALSHLNVIHNRKMGAFYSGMHPEDRIFCFLPFYHCYGQNFIFNASIFCGATLYLDNIKLSDVDSIFSKLKESKVTSFYGIPVVYDLLLSNPKRVKDDLKSIRYFLCGADFLSSDTEKRWFDLTGKHLFQAYGKTELSPLHTSSQYHLWKPNSVGRAMKGCSNFILNLETNKTESKPYQKGEVLTKGPNNAVGYLKDGEIVKCYDEDGFHHTNDTGYLDEQGYLYLIGRTDDMFIINGENIYPQEIEKIVKEMDSSLITIAGSITLDNIKKVVLCLEIKSSYSHSYRQKLEEGLSQIFSKKLPHYKIPKKYYWVNSFPRTSSGKVIRKQLLESIQNNANNYEK